MKYYIIAGEASGDLHGSNLIKALKQQDSNAQIRCWGGDLMQAEGADLVKHYRELAFMGFVEVVKNLPTILKNITFCKHDILTYQPDVLVLIDYPGFNLRIAEWAKAQGLKVVYYIAPQVWAWKANRVKKMRQCIDLMLCILPFEQAYFKDHWNWDVAYVGHPLLQVVQAIQEKGVTTQLSTQPIVALLPGSRKQEIGKKLPIMLAVAKHFPAHQFIVAKAPGQEDAFYEPMLAQYKNVSSVRNDTYNLLMQSKAALVTSGTATLETALFKVPEVICYKSSHISYAIGKRLVKIKFIGLVNLIMNKLVVKELIQHDLTVNNLVQELNQLLNDPVRKQAIATDYDALQAILQTGSNASETAAKKILALMSI